MVIMVRGLQSTTGNEAALTGLPHLSVSYDWYVGVLSGSGLAPCFRGHIRLNHRLDLHLCGGLIDASSVTCVLSPSWAILQIDRAPSYGSGRRSAD